MSYFSCEKLHGTVIRILITVLVAAQGASNRSKSYIVERRAILIEFFCPSMHNTRSLARTCSNQRRRRLFHAGSFSVAAGAAPEETNQRSSSAHNRHSVTKGKCAANAIDIASG